MSDTTPPPMPEAIGAPLQRLWLCLQQLANAQIEYEDCRARAGEPDYSAEKMMRVASDYRQAQSRLEETKDMVLQALIKFNREERLKAQAGAMPPLSAPEDFT